MRRRIDRGNYPIASLFVISALSLGTPVFAQSQLVPPATTDNPEVASAPAPFPKIIIGRTVITVADKSRQGFRDSVDNCVCVAPESVAAALGTSFTIDNRSGKAYFLNNETGATATAVLRTPPATSSSRGSFVAVSPLAEALGGKCENDVKNNTLHIRSVLLSVEMIGSQLRVRGTLPLSPKITRINGGKTVAFDFIGAEIGTIPKSLTALGPTVLKARTGQFDGDTARIVLELDEAKPFSILPSSPMSTLSVISSAPGAQTTASTVAATTTSAAPVVTQEETPIGTTDVAPPVSVTLGSNGKPISSTSTPVLPAGKPAVPTLLTGVRFVRISDTQARIIVDSASAPAVRTLLTKARLTLDVQNGVFGPGTQSTIPDATHPLLKGVQAVNTSATTAQLLIDLTRAVNFTVRLDPKGGFVVDLTLPRGAGGRIVGKLIVVDPGHGGTDSGAKGVNGAREKNVALGIARCLADELRDKGANVILTRDTDNFVELGERSNISNRAGADLFVAIHADSAGASASGSTVYYHLNDASERILAECVADRFREMGGIRTYGARSDRRMYVNGFSVLRRTNTLAILCETGYMSNMNDVSQLVQPQMQAKIARSIANGIQDYIEGNRGPVTTKPSPEPDPTVVQVTDPEVTPSPAMVTEQP